jgi:hypothetical protein
MFTPSLEIERSVAAKKEKSNNQTEGNEVSFEEPGRTLL